MIRKTTPMLYWVTARHPDDRIHRGRPSLADLRAVVRRYPMAWVVA